MTDLAERAQRKRITLPNHFSYPVVIEDIAVHDGTALLRVKRPDGGLEEVTLDEPELEAALIRGGAAADHLASGVDLRYALEAVDASLRPDITVAVRMARENQQVLDYYLLPRIDISTPKLRLSEENGFWLDAYRFDSLDAFFYLAARTHVRTAA